MFNNRGEKAVSLADNLPTAATNPNYDEMGNYITALDRKKADLEASTAQKQAELNANIPLTADDLFRLKPDTTNEEYKQWEYLRRQQLEKQQHDLDLKYQSGSGLNIAKDAAVSLGKGVAIALPEIAYEVTNLASIANPAEAIKGALRLAKEFGKKEDIGILKSLPIPDSMSLDEAMRKAEINPEFGKAREYVNKKFLSEGSQDSIKQVDLGKQLYDIGRRQREMENDKAGKTGVRKVLEEEAGAFVESISQLVDNPQAALDVILESAPQAVAAGGITKLGTLAMDASTPIGKAALREVAERIAVGYTAASEAGSNASQVREAIFATPDAELQETNPEYKALRSQISELEAKSKLSRGAELETAGISGVLGGWISKKTGAAAWEGNLFNQIVKESGTKMTVKEALKAGLGSAVERIAPLAKEGLEETGQGITGTLASNYAIQDTVDPSQRLFADTGWNAGAGLVAGVGSVPVTGALVGAYETAKAIPSPKQVAELLKAGKDSVKATVAENRIDAPKPVNMTKKMAQFADKTEADIKPETTPSDALAILLAEKNVPKTPEEMKGHVAKLDDKYRSLFAAVSEKMQAHNAKTYTNAKEREKGEAEIDALQDELGYFNEKIKGIRAASTIAPGATEVAAPAPQVPKEEAATAIRAADASSDALEDVFKKTLYADFQQHDETLPVESLAPGSEGASRLKTTVEKLDIALSAKNLSPAQIEALTARKKMYDEFLNYGQSHTKKAGEVAKDILSGGRGFLGATQYVEGVMQAVKTPTETSMKEARSLLTALQGFANNQRIKADNQLKKAESLKTDPTYKRELAFAKRIDNEAKLLESTLGHLSIEYKRGFNEAFNIAGPTEELINKINTEQKAIEDAAQAEKVAALGKAKKIGIDNIVNLANKRDLLISEFTDPKKSDQLRAEIYGQQAAQLEETNLSLAQEQAKYGSDPDIKAAVAEARKGKAELADFTMPESVAKELDTAAKQYNAATNAGRKLTIEGQMAKRGLTVQFNKLIKPPVKASGKPEVVDSTVTPPTGGKPSVVPVGPGDIYVKDTVLKMYQSAKTNPSPKAMESFKKLAAKTPGLFEAVEKKAAELEGKPTTTKPTVTPPVDTPTDKASVADIAAAIRKNPKGIPQRLVEKDAKKAESATQFIGIGSSKSSTAIYAKLFDKFANTGEYKAEDKVFVSLNGGNSSDRISIKKPNGKAVLDLLKKAVAAGSTIIADNAANRGNGYNTGELELVEFLSSKAVGYAETNGDGVWKPVKAADEPAKPTKLSKLQLKAVVDQLTDLSARIMQARTQKDLNTAKQERSAIVAGLKTAGTYKQVKAVFVNRKTKPVVSNTPPVAAEVPVIEERSEADLEADFLSDGPNLDDMPSDEGIPPDTTQDMAAAPVVLSTLNRIAVLKNKIDFDQLTEEQQTEVTSLEEPGQQLKLLTAMAQEMGKEKAPVFIDEVEFESVEKVLKGILDNSVRNEAGESAFAALFSMTPSDKNILHGLKDFFTNQDTYNKLYNQLSESQKYSLDMLKQFHDKMFPIVKSLMGVSSKDGLEYQDKNPVEYLYNQVVTGIQKNTLLSNPNKWIHDKNVDFIEDNIVSAIVLAAYNWVGQESANTIKNYEDNVKGILGYDSDDQLPWGAYKAFTEEGTPSTSLKESMGNGVMKILGIREKSSTPEGVYSRLPMAFGFYVHQALINAKMIEINKIPTQTVNQYAKNPSRIAEQPAAIQEGGNAEIEGQNQFQLTSEDGGRGDVINERSYVSFTRVLTHSFEKEGETFIEAIPEVQQYIDATKVSRNLLSEFFGASEYTTPPSLAPLEPMVNKIKGSSMLMPKEILLGGNRMQEAEWTLDDSRLQVWALLDKATQEAMAGILTDEEIAAQHISKRDSLEANNAGKRREIEQLKEFIAELRGTKKGIKTPFWLKAFATKAGRLDYATNINPVSSKVHRWFMNMKDWSVTIPAKGKEKYDFSTQNMRNAFLLAIGASFGVKVDLSQAAKVEETLALIADPTITEAVDALKQLQMHGRDVANKAELEQKILKAMKKGGEKLHTFAALEALTRYHPTNSFTTNLFLEVDGKTNGPAITLFQYLGWSDPDQFMAMANKVGVYFDETKTYGEWKEILGTFDSYQQFAVWVEDAFSTLNDLYTQTAEMHPVMLSIVNDYTDAVLGKEEAFIALQSLIGPLTETKDGVTKVSSAMRLLHKPPVMTQPYGIGMDTMAANYSENFIGLLYDQMMAIDALPETAGNPKEGIEAVTAETKKAKIEATLAAVAAVMGKTVDQLVGYDENTASNIKDFQFSQTVPEGSPKGTLSDYDAIHTFLGHTYGAALRTVFFERYEEMRTSRQEMNNMISIVYAAYAEMYRYYEEKMLNEKVQAITSKMTPDEAKEAHPRLLKSMSLTFAEIRQLQDSLLPVAPLFKGPFSSKDPNDHSDSVMVLKQDDSFRVWNNLHNAHAYRAEVSYNDAGYTDGKVKYSKQYGSKDAFSPPGVSAGPIGVQHIDGAIQAEMQAKYWALNVKDAVGLSLKDAYVAPPDMDKFFLNHMTDYNMKQAVHDTLKRVASILQSEPKEIQDHVRTTIVNAGILDGYDDKNARVNFTNINDMVTVLGRTVANEKRVRDAFISQITYVSQYPFGDTRHEVPTKVTTEEQAATVVDELIQEQVQKLNPAIDPEATVNSDITLPELGDLNTRKDFDATLKLVPQGVGRTSLGIALLAANLANARVIYARVKEAFDLAKNNPYRTLNEQQLLKITAMFGEDYYTRPGTFQEARTYEEDGSDIIDFDNVTPPLEDSITFGSVANSNLNRTDFNGKPGTALNSGNVAGIFEGLTTVGPKQDSATHTTHLRKVVHDIGTKILGPYVMHKQVKGARTIGETDMDAMYMNIGNQLMSQLDLSAAEVYSHELVHKAIAYALDNNPGLRIQAEKLFDQVLSEIKRRAAVQGVEPHMMLAPQNATTADVSAALQMYNYIFENSTQTAEIKPILGTNKVTRQFGNNYLHEFMAYGLTNETLNNLLKSMDKDSLVTPKPTNFVQRMIALYDKVINFITEKMVRGEAFKTGTAADRLYALGEALSQTNTQGAGKLQKFYDGSNKLLLKGLDSYVRAPLVAFARSKYMQNNTYLESSRFRPVAAVGRLLVATGTLVDTAASFGADQFRLATEKTLKRMGQTEEGFIMHTMAEILPSTTPAKIWEGLHRYSLNAIDQLRKQVSSSLTKQLIDVYADVPGRPEKVTQAEKTGVTAMVIRADIGALLSDTLETRLGFSYTLPKVRDLISNTRTLQREIQAIERLLKSAEYGVNGNHYIRQARSLGHMQAQDEAIEEHTQSNAHDIAQLYALEDLSASGVQHIQKRGDLAKAESLIDVLATLYAIEFTNYDVKKDFLAVYDRETPRGVDSGLNFTIHAHEMFKKKSAEQLFENNKAHIRKGYIRETYDPYIEFKIASGADKDVLFNRGFTQKSRVRFDLNDPVGGADMWLYTNDTGRPNRIKGVTSLTAEVGKGADLVRVRSQQNDPQAFMSAGIDLMRLKATKLPKVLDQFTTDAAATIDPDHNMLVPIIATNGEISTYRYMMSRDKKVAYLKLQDPFDVVMGNMLGSITDKVNTKQVNKEIVKLAFQDYQQNYQRNSAEFTAISLSSLRPKDRELYYLMPQDMRKEIRRTFGADAIYIRTSMLKTVFGYKQWSITDLRDKAGGLGTTYRTLLKLFGVVSLNKVNDHNLRKIENLWQEVIGLAKDSIVVKSVDVLADNIMSNTLLLWAKGVPFADIIKHSHVAIVGSRTYNKDKQELDNLKREYAYDPTRKHLPAQMAKIAERMARNPVAELINAGVYQSIMEDVEAFNLPETYATPLEKLVSPVTGKLGSKLNPKVKRAGEIFLLKHDTQAYQILRYVTQLSDFTARYVLHQHNLNVKKMSREDSVHNIVKTFINYDIPTHEGLDYANRMGLAMFTKYFLRVQQIAVALAFENPSRVLVLALGQLLFGPVSNIMNSSVLEQGMLSHFQNPLGVPFGSSEMISLELVKDGLKATF